MKRNWVVWVIFLLCWIVNLKCFNTCHDNQPFISFPPPLPGNIAECVCVFALWLVLKERHSHGGECNQCLASAGRCQAEQASWAQALDMVRDREKVCVCVCVWGGSAAQFPFLLTILLPLSGRRMDGSWWINVTLPPACQRASTSTPLTASCPTPALCSTHKEGL